VPALGNVTAIAAGGYSVLTVLSDGTLDAWGYNRLGYLGDGSTADSAVPVKVQGLQDATAIAVDIDNGFAVEGSASGS
jgi:alpha-tubulin suppressor-like RCC1 family protein